MSAHIKRTKRSQINGLMLQLKLLENQEQTNPKTSRRREKIKIRSKINEIEINKQKKYKESMKQNEISFTTTSWLHPKDAGVVQHMQIYKCNTA
jgi:hypothetical protein